jgi:hypothetical protein
LSHKRRDSSAENLEWIAKRNKEREEAARKSAEQRRAQNVPGFKRMTVEDEY